MPVIKSAKKKLRQDKKREKRNKLLRTSFKSAVKDAQKSKSAQNILKAIKLTDKAVKKRLIHKNKAARVKSALNKLVKTTETKKKTSIKTTKKTKVVKSKK